MTDHQLFQDFTFHNVEQLDGCRVPVRPLSAQSVLQEGSLFYNLTDNLPYVSTGTVWLPVLAGTSDVAADIAITAQDIALTADVDDITLTAADDIKLSATGDVIAETATGSMTFDADNVAGSGITLNANSGGVDINTTGGGVGIGGFTLTTAAGEAATFNASSFVVNGASQLVTATTNMVLEAQGVFPFAVRIQATNDAGGIDLNTGAVSGQISMNGRIITDLITASSGPAAVPTQSRLHQITTTGTGDALTLANGAAGQHLDLFYVAEGAGADTAILTPATLAGGTTITFNALGDTASLVYNATGGWYKTGGSAVLA